MKQIALAILALVAGVVAAVAEETSVRTVSGDFDGDGQPDVAEHRLESEQHLLTVRLGVAPQDQIIVLQGPRERAGNFLRVQPPGVYHPFPFEDTDPPPVVVEHEAISYGTTESSEAIIYWTNEGFRIIWVSD